MIDKYPIKNEEAPSVKLIGYLKEQFQAAYEMQELGYFTEDHHDNGTFVKSMVVLDNDRLPPLLDQSERIILKPPHPNDIPGYYCEAYAIYDREDTEESGDRRPATNAKTFVLRDFSNGRPGQFWAINKEGASELNVATLAEETIKLKHVIDSAQSFNKNPLENAQERAADMYKKYENYNIVASLN